MSASFVDSLCALLGAGLMTNDDVVAAELVSSWLAGQLPNRAYDRPYVAPPPLVFPAEPERVQELTRSEPTPNLKRSSDGEQRMTVKLYDVVRHVASGETTTSENQRADGSVVAVTTDAGAEPWVRLQESCVAGAVVANEVLTTQIFGAQPPRAELIDTLARLFIIMLFEPVRLCIDVQFTRPVTSDVELALVAAAQSVDSSQTDRLDTDTLLQSCLASFTVNWFTGVAELAAIPRMLRADTLSACATALTHASVLFDPAQCVIDEMQARLAGFRHNAQLARQLDRGRLLGAFCRTFVNLRGAEHASFTREVCIVAIDRTFVRALAIARTPAGSRFANTADVKRNCGRARQLLRSMHLDDVPPAPVEPTPAELVRSIVAAIRAKI